MSAVGDFRGLARKRSPLNTGMTTLMFIAQHGHRRLRTLSAIHAMRLRRHWDRRQVPHASTAIPGTDRPCAETRRRRRAGRAAPSLAPARAAFPPDESGTSVVVARCATTGRTTARSANGAPTRSGATSWTKSIGFSSSRPRLRKCCQMMRMAGETRAHDLCGRVGQVRMRRMGRVDQHIVVAGEGESGIDAGQRRGGLAAATRTGNQQAFAVQAHCGTVQQRATSVGDPPLQHVLEWRRILVVGRGRRRRAATNVRVRPRRRTAKARRRLG